MQHRTRCRFVAHGESPTWKRWVQTPAGMAPLLIGAQAILMVHRYRELKLSTWWRSVLWTSSSCVQRSSSIVAHVRLYITTLMRPLNHIELCRVARRNLERNLHMNVAALVIDEAHIGDNASEFRGPAYQSIRRFRAKCSDPTPMLLSTATPPRDRVQEMCTIYGLKNPNVIRTSPKRENITINVITLG